MEEKISISLDGQTYDIPVEGSLGLLALGHVGVALWRKKRDALQQESEKKSESKLSD